MGWLYVQGVGSNQFCCLGDPTVGFDAGCWYIFEHQNEVCAIPIASTRPEGVLEAV